MPAVEDFLKTILRSGLLDREQLQQALRSVPAEQRENPDAVAAHLVKGGNLTRFQVRKLLRGAAAGLVLGPFQILAPIGRGGMGTVYLGRDTRSGQRIALKVLPPKRAREEARLLARFRREMDMSQRVAHAHIAWTYEVGVCRGIYYLAMEYIPGKSLYRTVAEQGPMKIARAARIFAELASALEHAHGQGVIHRDLKPSNIMITPHDHAKLLDLGLALIQGEKGAEREVVGGQGYTLGTMDYLSPEQAVDPTKVDARSDIYGLGCTLYYTITGRVPFPGGSSREKINRHKTEEPPLIESLNPEVPAEFATLVRKMMAKQPRDRFLSATELRRALAPWAAGDTALPMDTPDDASYKEAVALLESAEPEPAVVEEVGAASEGKSTEMRKEGKTSEDFALVFPQPRKSEEPANPRLRAARDLGARREMEILILVLSVALGVLVLGGAACAGLLYLLLRR